MSDIDEVPSFAALHRALATGDMQAIRSAVLALDAEGQQALEVRLGADATRRLFQLTRRVRRGVRRGRVIVIHGIMGAQLDSIKRGDADRVWLNYWRLFNGRIEELRLSLDGQPAEPEYNIRVSGMFPEYLPLLTELADQWSVLPFAFDWRQDIDASAAALAVSVKTWANGEPAHIVAHSMGGLVSRRFIKLYPRIWESMQDPAGRGRGGRLIMLGTPNKGSFAIPLVLTGKEKTVTKLATLDVRHNMNQLLGILGTFPGSYQMLPSPLVDADDDRRRLFDSKVWGVLPVREELLTAGRLFQESLHQVIDPERLIYVAGYDQTTPYRIRIDKPGRFSYQTTPNGDGRVPHELGLLEGVRTFWVKELHGDLARNRAVLAGIHELLVQGTTTKLEQDRPATRAVDKHGEWLTADAIELDRAEELSIIAQPLRRGTTGSPIDGVKAARYESLILSAYLGTPERGTSRGSGESTSDVRLRASRKSRVNRDVRLRVRVVWGDITKASGDVYVAGHYDEVPPQFAERALDRVISGVENEIDRGDDEGLVVTSLTRRGIISGALGQVAFFPWAHKKGRLVAIAGMGHPGGFGSVELRRLASSLMWAISALPYARTVNTVLIGSGAGNMKASAAVEGLILGLLEARGLMAVPSRVRTLCIVERDFRKAAEILAVLQDFEKRQLSAKRAAPLVDDAIVTGVGGEMGQSQCLSLALAAVIRASRSSVRSRERKALKTLMEMIPTDSKFRQKTTTELEAAARDGPRDLVEQARQIGVDLLGQSNSGDRPKQTVPTRLSFVRDGAGICAAAITNTAVVPERRLSFDFTLVEEAGVNMTDPADEQVPTLSSFLTRLVLPREFRELLEGEAPVVFEVDRSMARLRWEMLAKMITDDDVGEPLALTCAVSRQLRTTYSPPPSMDHRRPGPLRALVIGDPGDPKQGHSLPGAAEEALAVAELLRKKNVDVTVMVGAPSVPREGKLRDIRAASRIDVLSELMKGGYDLLHYAGHGDFDEAHPDTVGWLFESGLITSRELERIDLAPRLVVANACLSGVTSEALARGERVWEGHTEADLLPGLADEFFKRGVRNYIGTAWEVNDVGAVSFATAFYEALIPNEAADPGRPPTIGEALLFSRQQLNNEKTKFGTLWAAYQHYGDPTQVFVPVEGRRGMTSSVARPAAKSAERTTSNTPKPLKSGARTKPRKKRAGRTAKKLSKKSARTKRTPR